ncbi:hypothetical protein BOTBODRAFT_623276 [Botryobasidium botryosum FD-172 SS1]|uniref:DNA 3'-5' helicase n=1 Tax=Botryobasidium botryosum (strain FD-172 SS1) TaxID=930990 RepID=A0A067MJR0_BOTB1|nr:hypothetical protein BOTBODRAFT_623276 [Botryobasidium botryosum FD-172 SS1]
MPTHTPMSDEERQKTREKLIEIAREKFHFTPYEWQIEVTLAIIEGRDTVCIAGTGSGKSLLFALPSLLTGKMTLVLSPLNVLEEDQASGFSKLGVRAIALNSENYKKSVLDDIAAGKYDVVVTSPEMVLESKTWEPLLTDPRFSERIGMIAVDEAHCIKQWGEPSRDKKKAFRPAYGKVGNIRSLLPRAVPFLAASATLEALVLADVQHSLHMGKETYVVNRGNDRPNINMVVLPMQYSIRSLEDVVQLVAPKEQELKSTMVFCNARYDCHDVQSVIRRELKKEDHDKVVVYHALRSEASKRRAMDRFKKGEIKVLICTEAAGMGADIRHVELVVQLGVPSSLSVWIQRAGRAGRNRSILAKAILLVPPSFYKTVSVNVPPKKPPKKPVVKVEPGTDNPAQGDDLEDAAGSDDERVGQAGANVKKLPGKYEKSIIDYILIKTCRREFLDAYYENPLGDLPDGLCCDICSGITTSQPFYDVDDVISVSSGSDPEDDSAEIINPGQKRKRDDGLAHTHRTRSHALRCRTALENWREATWEGDLLAYSVLPLDSIMTEKILKRLAHDTRITTISKLRDVWPLAESYGFGEAVLELLRTIDDEYEERVRADLLEKELRQEESERMKRQKKDEAEQKKEKEKEARQASAEAKKMAKQVALEAQETIKHEAETMGMGHVFQVDRQEPSSEPGIELNITAHQLLASLLDYVDPKPIWGLSASFEHGVELFFQVACHQEPYLCCTINFLVTLAF